MSYLNKYGIELIDPDYDPFADLMALGEGYMRGKWTSEDLGRTLYHLTYTRDIINLVKDKTDCLRLEQKHVDPEYVNDVHYDEYEDIILHMIGPSLLYTGADFRGCKTLEEAQRQKVQRINKKIELEDGMRVLDLGCGWGGYAMQTTADYDVDVVGVTNMPNSARIAGHYCDVHVCDYSQIRGKFDRVVSMGLLEHVGIEHLRKYMKTVYRCLKPEGLSLIQTIGYNSPKGAAHPWIDKYIFPSGALPSFAQIAQAMETLFVLEDVENLGMQYAYTVDAWYDNFRHYLADGELKRKWAFFLMFFRAAFLTREYQLWHIVMSKRRLAQAVRV